MNTEAQQQQTITLAGTQFTVEVQGDMIWLTGKRGGVYFLRAMHELNGVTGARMGDSGIRQVISWTSGQPLRVRGNEIRVLHIGNIIEQA